MFNGTVIRKNERNMFLFTFLPECVHHNSPVNFDMRIMLSNFIDKMQVYVGFYSELFYSIKFTRFQKFVSWSRVLALRVYSCTKLNMYFKLKKYDWGGGRRFNDLDWL